MKSALVTGADRGFGFLLAKELLESGWRVFAGRYLKDYQLLDDLRVQYPQTLVPVDLDVGDARSVQSAYEEVCAQTDSLDLLVSNAAYMGGPETSQIKGEYPIDYDLLLYSMQVNAFGALHVAQTFLPLMDKGEMKRMCFLSSEASSISMMLRDGEFRYTMSKTALNMAVRMLHNTLSSQGYTFRLYQPGGMKRMLADGSLAAFGMIDPAVSVREAIRQFTGSRIDEHRLILTDYLGQEWAF